MKLLTGTVHPVRITASTKQLSSKWHNRDWPLNSNALQPGAPTRRLNLLQQFQLDMTASAAKTIRQKPLSARRSSVQKPPSVRSGSVQKPPSVRSGSVQKPPSVRNGSMPRPPSARNSSMPRPPSARNSSMPRPPSERNSLRREASSVRRSSVQIGINRDVDYRGTVFHVQTEDTWPHSTHVRSHIFCSGAVVASRKTEYDALDRSPADIHSIMRNSHSEICSKLLNGKFDQRIYAQTGRKVFEPQLHSSLDLKGRRSVGPAVQLEPAATVVPPAAATVVPPAAATVVPPAAATIVPPPKPHTLSDAQVCLSSIQRQTEGFIAAALVDQRDPSKMETLGSTSNTAVVKLAASGGASLLDAQMRLLEQLQLCDILEHISITIERRFCIICPVDSYRFLYVIVDRATGNLAMVQRVVQTALHELQS